MLQRSLAFLFLFAFSTSLLGSSLPDDVDELLDFYCYDCHGYGKKEGGIQLDELSLSKDHGDLWERIWGNVRTGMMPPAEGEPFDPEEKKELLDWLERNPLGIDRRHPDPGRVTMRRHNRVEFQATVEDLLGLEFDSAEHFPPDDTGYGFDTIGDVLTISPLLAERFFEAAKILMEEAVPDNAAAIPAVSIPAHDFKDRKNPQDTGRFIEFNRPQTVSRDMTFEKPGRYEIILNYAVGGSADATDHTATFVMGVSGRELARKELGWDFQKGNFLKAEVDLIPGRHRLTLQISENEPPGEGEGELGVMVSAMSIRGPLGSRDLRYPRSYRKVISKANSPENRKEWPIKARAVVQEFASRAWRRPVAEETVNNLTVLALEAANHENSFEAGIRQAGIAILASPRFILRSETALPTDSEEDFPLIDEWSLASRLSYFLWSSLPDAELRRHAAAGTLRENLDQQVERMLADERSSRFSENFIGQWLQARDVETLGIRPEVVLNLHFRQARRRFSKDLRRDMRMETEALFSYILETKKPAVELISADYSFLNRRLAQFYGIDGVESERLIKTKMPRNRGGILTQGNFLVVTSNPTRTSPVKRGLFVLDNLLGTPPPPAPPDIPELEEAAHEGGALTMKERMVEHRKNPDCRSCHQRMDPIGLAFENFTAVGSYREMENGKPIETDGELVTGEKFADVTELKKVLAVDRKDDFHRCLAEKLLTYALGRGVEYYDAPAIDEVVRRMEAKGGTLHEAVHAVIDSISFQRRRR